MAEAMPKAEIEPFGIIEKGSFSPSAVLEFFG
jgi:hypothetical protein